MLKVAKKRVHGRRARAFRTKAEMSQTIMYSASSSRVRGKARINQVRETQRQHEVYMNYALQEDKDLEKAIKMLSTM